MSSLLSPNSPSSIIASLPTRLSAFTLARLLLCPQDYFLKYCVVATKRPTATVIFLHPSPSRISLQCKNPTWTLFLCHRPRTLHDATYLVRPGRPLVEEEKVLGDDWKGITNLSYFLLVDSDFLFIYLRARRYIKTIYLSTTCILIFACIRHRLNDAHCKWYRNTQYYSPVPLNVVFYLNLLLDSEYIYRREPRPYLRRPFVHGKSLYRRRALPNNLEHRVELSSHNLFVYLGRRAPEHPMPEET